MKLSGSKCLLVLLTVIIAIGLSSTTYAQSPSFNGDPYAAATDPNLAGGKPGLDEHFIERGLGNVNDAVIFSKLALTKSTNSDVKALAQKVVDKHIAMGGPLVQDAKAFKIAVPKGLTKQYAHDYAQLNGLSGDAFDKAYLAVLLRLQHDDYGNMLDESRATKVPHIQDETGKDLPTLAQLDDEAQKLSRKLNGPK
jgi:putative membrane protein